MLLWRSVSIYVLPMIRVYVGRFFGFLARSCFASLECLVNYKYTDRDFPAEWYMGGDPGWDGNCLLYTSPSPRDKRQSRMPSSA